MHLVAKRKNKPQTAHRKMCSLLFVMKRVMARNTCFMLFEEWLPLTLREDIHIMEADNNRSSANLMNLLFLLSEREAKKMPNQFVKRYHPLIIMCYYLILLVSIMSTTNPWFLTFYFIGSQSLQIIKKRNYRSFGYSLLVMLVLTLTNPLVVHRGGTILFFLFNKPVTKEALIYGFFMGVLFAAIFLIFQNMQEALESGTWSYLVGRKFPKMTMILTLVFHFIPIYIAYYQELRQVQKTLKNTSSKGFKARANDGLALFGHLFSWSLESAMDTADAMIARGYGEQKRSSRLIYNWHVRDSIAFFFCIVFAVVIFYVNSHQLATYAYYPYSQSLIYLFKEQRLVYLLVLFFSIYPTILTVKETILWKILELRI